MFWLPSPLPVHTAPPLLTHPCSIRALARHFPPRIQRVRRAQLRLRHPEDAAGTSARRDRSEHFRRCCGSRSFASIGPKRISYNVTCSQNITCCLRLLGSHLAHAQLFPRGALEFYTAKNMGWHVTEAQVRRLRVSCRGLRVRVRC